MEECSVVFNEVFIFNPSVIHVGEKPFTCTYPCDSGGTPTICGERFRRSDELTRHRRRHADERPFVCTECSQAFRRADHLSVHFRRHEREALIRSRSVISSESKPVAVPVSKTFISDQSHPIECNEKNIESVKEPVTIENESTHSSLSRPSTPPPPRAPSPISPSLPPSPASAQISPPPSAPTSAHQITPDPVIPPLSCVLLTGTFVCLLPTDLLATLIASSVATQLGETASENPAVSTPPSTFANHVDS
ncbi:hypothetical protein FBUS_06697 [Fasciolopsis buskii]|uniref:C2H2-type domain-containing protein n=1 Tax=Fasciolopsis buskii TaxID=27845 RepID=A0A8E0SA90_9TREM|nr:hypothetical protein FBUS_06697 [Fasciolopsis buski]